MASTDPPDVVELWTGCSVLVIDMRARLTRRHQELVHVLDGELTIEVADQVITLATGDAASFAGDSPHSYANAPRSRRGSRSRSSTPARHRRPAVGCPMSDPGT